MRTTYIFGIDSIPEEVGIEGLIENFDILKPLFRTVDIGEGYEVVKNVNWGMVV